jgi:kumamolisin
MPTKKTIPIRGSNKKALAGASVVGPAPKDEWVEVTVRVRPRNPLPDRKDMLRASAAPTPIISHEQFDKQYGSTEKDFAAIRKFAKAHDLTVGRESSSRRTVILGGTVENLNKAFHVSLNSFVYPDGTYRGRTGQIHIPSELGDIIEGVFGLDNRPVARRRSPSRASASASSNGAQPFDPVQVASLYNFPGSFDGTGQTIGIIELGGGYRPDDLKTYFQGLGQTVPTVIPVSVDGGTNSPGQDADDEVALDIDVIGRCAPGARLVVYFTPDASDDSFLDAITKAVHDTEYNPSVISISWGGTESGGTQVFQQQFDDALQAAAMLGITVCAASGDNGAANDPPRLWRGEAQVNFPASSPFALACGGTRLISTGASIAEESVWNQHKAEFDQSTGPDGSFGATGGGVSQFFPLPAYQSNANVPASVNPGGKRGRGVPDVTGDGDSASGYNIYFDGSKAVVGGTSAVAPLWAALIARFNQKLGGRVGFINPQIYALPPNSGAFNDIVVGDNKCSYQNFNNVGYTAGPGWDACSGLGSPNGSALANLLKAATASGNAVAPAANAQPAVTRRKATAGKTSTPRRTRRAKEQPKQLMRR